MRHPAQPPAPGDDRLQGLRNAVLRHYEGQLARHGPSPRGMDWKDAASQQLRFAVLCEVCDLRDRSVHEIGSGAGHLADFLAERGIGTEYSGSDLSAVMVEAARTRHPGVAFEQRDILREQRERTHDVVLCSGLFHVKLDRAVDEWRAFVQESVRRMFSMCRVGIAFNLMSDQVDFRSDSLYYASLGDVADFCRSELSRHITVRHDYPLYEFTTFVYRDARVR